MALGRLRPARIFAKPDTHSSMLPWMLLLLAICAVSFWLRNEQIGESMPYPRHVDEGGVMDYAARIVTTGDYHPGRLVYPSLPIYLASAGLGIGFIRAAANLEVRAIKDIGNVSHPYYSFPTIVKTARQLFALMSVIALAATGAAAWFLLQRAGALVLAPVILALSPFFFLMSWRYVNVDIVGACFATLTIAATLKGSRRREFRWLIVVPAACAGLAASSKYIYGVVLLSVLLSIWLFSERGRRLEGLVVSVLVAGVAFVATSPYTVLDLPAFLNGLAFDAHHYATGHPGYESDPGFGKFAHYGSLLVEDLGWVALVAALVGLVAMARSDWRRTLVLISFPVGLVALLATQRVEFPRNILPIFPLYAVVVAAGLCAVGSVLKAQIVARWKPNALGTPVAAAVVALPVVAAMAGPLMTFPDQLRTPRDSRVDAAAWIEANIPLDWKIVIPEELGLDARPLSARGYWIRIAPFKTLDSVEAIKDLLGPTDSPVAVLVPEWGSDPRWPGEELAASLNQAADETPMSSIKSFPGRRLKINYRQPLPTGNPAIDIRVVDS